MVERGTQRLNHSESIVARHFLYFDPLMSLQIADDGFILVKPSERATFIMNAHKCFFFLITLAVSRVTASNIA